jgi:hypothetical protein
MVLHNLSSHESVIAIIVDAHKGSMLPLGIQCHLLYGSHGSLWDWGYVYPSVALPGKFRSSVALSEREKKKKKKRKQKNVTEKI